MLSIICWKVIFKEKLSKFVNDKLYSYLELLSRVKNSRLWTSWETLRIYIIAYANGKEYIIYIGRRNPNYTIYINQLHLKSIEVIKGLNQ